MRFSKELDFLGITIHTATGKVTKIDGALRALMGEMYLENLALHVRRGLEGVIRDGRHAGGRAYGYSIVPGWPGELVIDDAQARIVPRIFAHFVAGAAPRALAAELNADRIAAPRGNRKRSARLQCGTCKESGSCTNSRKVNRDAIEAAVFAELKDELSNPIAITEYIKAYNDERRRLAREAGD